MGDFGPLYIRKNMATTIIANEISDITKNGETPDPHFIVSAQKFVVANIPMQL